MIDRDFSFLRLRDNLDDAMNLSESPVIDIEYHGQVHLIPGETYLQISNSPTPITFNSNYTVFLVDRCNNEIQEITDNVFVHQFTDSNAINQVVWEWINTVDLPGRLVCLRFTNTVNDDVWWSNPFVTTKQNSRFTSRYDYKSKGIHDGIQYDIADFYQSIRLSTYFNNYINESTRTEYHQISTGITVTGRNIKDIREEYICHQYSQFAIIRTESMLTSDEVYTDTVNTFSSTPIEFEEREGDSNFVEYKLILNKNYNRIFNYSLQIAQQLQIVSLSPQGEFPQASIFANFSATFNSAITLKTGNIQVYRDTALIGQFDQGHMTVVGSTLSIDVSSNTDVSNPVNGNYSVLMSSGLVKSNYGFDFAGISSHDVWTINVGIAFAVEIAEGGCTLPDFSNPITVYTDRVPVNGDIVWADNDILYANSTKTTIFAGGAQSYAFRGISPTVLKNYRVFSVIGATGAIDNPIECNSQGQTIFLGYDSGSSDLSDNTYYFLLGYLALNYINNAGNSISHIIIKTLTNRGQLYLGNNAVSDNDTISVADINAGNFVYYPINRDLSGTPGDFNTDFNIQIVSETGVIGNMVPINLTVTDNMEEEELVLTSFRIETTCYVLQYFRVNVPAGESRTLRIVKNGIAPFLQPGTVGPTPDPPNLITTTSDIIVNQTTDYAIGLSARDQMDEVREVTTLTISLLGGNISHVITREHTTPIIEC